MDNQSPDSTHAPSRKRSSGTQAGASNDDRELKKQKMDDQSPDSTHAPSRKRSSETQEGAINDDQELKKQKMDNQEAGDGSSQEDLLSLRDDEQVLMREDLISSSEIEALHQPSYEEVKDVFNKNVDDHVMMRENAGDWWDQPGEVIKLGGEIEVSLFQKKLAGSDARMGQSRLLITEEEKGKVKSDFLEVMTKGSEDVELELHLKKWASGSTVLMHHWKEFVLANNLQIGDLVEVLAYRVQGREFRLKIIKK